MHDKIQKITPFLWVLTACLLACLLVPQLVQAGGELGEDPYEIGEKLLAKQHYRTALKYFRKALERNDARAHYGMGRIYEETGKDRDALGEYRRFMELGQPDAQRSDVTRRLVALEDRLQAESARSTELLERGKSLYKNGEYREAEKALLQAAAKDQNNPEVHFYLGEVYLALEEYGKAKAEYNKAKGYY